jgi:crossover junction endodeoxyribonuclease RuvC
MPIILGIDPGLRACGWGVIQSDRGNLQFRASGTVRPPTNAPMAERLLSLQQELCEIVAPFQPDVVALEEVFVTRNGQSTLKLGQARGAIILAMAQLGLDCHEYAARQVKQAVSGKGNAAKEQVQQMVKYLLPHSQADSPDAADALAIAICHAHYASSPVPG